MPGSPSLPIYNPMLYGFAMKRISLNFRALTCMAPVGAGCGRELWSILGREEKPGRIQEACPCKHFWKID